MLKKLNNKKGFTLVEMIVVIAIIAILIGLIAPNVVKLIQTATNTANDGAAKTMQGSATGWGTDMFTIVGATFDKTNAKAVKDTDYFLYTVKPLTKKFTSLNAQLDAVFKFDSSQDPKSYLIGEGSLDFIHSKDLRVGYSYRFLFTEVGACGGVIIEDNSGKVVGLTKNLPAELDAIGRGKVEGTDYKWAELTQ